MMPVTVPLVAPLTVRVSPSPGNDPAVIWTAAKLSSVSSASVTLSAGESDTAAAFSLIRGVCRSTVMRGRVIDGHDRDKRDRGLAVVYAVVDDNFDDAVSRNRIVASRAEADRLQRSLVVSEGGDAGERQEPGDRVVSGSGDAARQTPVTVSSIAALRVRQRDGGRSEVVLPISGSPMRVSVSAIATGVPFSVNVVR